MVNARATQLRSVELPPLRDRHITLANTRAILFDLDGTLIDTMQAFADVAADVMVEHHGLDRVTCRRAYLATSGIPFFQQLEAIVPDDPRNAAAVEAFERRKLVATEDIVPSPDTIDALRDLQSLGLAIAVCSNNFQDQVDRFAATCGVRFDLALGFGGGLAKGPSHFELACRTFGCRHDRVVFVGDSVADAQLARASRIRFVGRLGTFGRDAFHAVVPGAPTITEISNLLWMLLP